MRGRLLVAGLAVCVAGVGLVGSTAVAQPTGATTPSAQRVCSTANPGHVACASLVRTDVKARYGVQPAAAPSGFGPADLLAAYDLPTSSTTMTVAIVDAYDDPTAESDLATYRSQYGLPACTTANGCFSKVDQRGGTDYPVANSGWDGEISLDVDMVSAICPSCHILLVEADAATIEDMTTAENEAVTLGAKAVSNSWSATPEDASELDLEQFVHHPGVAITAATGDDGYEVGWPANSPSVTAVGGTSLFRDTTTSRGWKESVWSGAGSGCSAYEPKPDWQTDTGCAKKTVADVSAIADPNTGVAVYQSGTWKVYGGTSVATPIIAATYALAGTPHEGTIPAEYSYDAVTVGAGGLNDVTGGKNGTCSPAYLCTGGPGFDGPTGLGTPDGVAAFTYQEHGTLSGKVIDSSGNPVADATVTAAGRTTKTGTDGTYHFDLPPADYQLSVNKYGYQPTSRQVTVTAGDATTADITLSSHATVTVSGTVTDGSGRGVPLAGTVTADDGTGHPVSVDADSSGHYHVALMTDTTYTLTVKATVPGYIPATRTVTVAESDLTQDVALVVDAAACTAPGYAPVETGTTQHFDATTAPVGWKVVNTDPHYPGYSAEPGWELTNPGGRSNDTGGEGNFAVVDSDHTGAMHVQETTLTGPVTDLSDAGTPLLRFDSDLVAAVNSTATVQASTDGGTTWTTVWSSSGVHGPHGTATVTVALPTAAHSSRVALRFGYTGSWSKYWEIDDVFLGDHTCQPKP